MDDAESPDTSRAQDSVCRASNVTPAKIYSVALPSPKPSASQGTDSGYGSATCCLTSDDAIELCTRHASQLFRRKVTKLKYIDNIEITLPEWRRFYDLTELFKRDFLTHLEKRNVNTRTLSIKLKCLGESEDTAKPYVVIQCEKTASKAVNQFFNQPHVKTQYQPCGKFPGTPWFNFVVWKRAPVSKAAADTTFIYCDAWDAADTLCGRAIKSSTHESVRFATLGGIVKVVRHQEDFALHGITAGHMLALGPVEEARDSPEDYVDVDMIDISDSEGNGDDCLFYEEEIELEVAIKEDPGMQNPDQSEEDLKCAWQSTQQDIPWSLVGKVCASSHNSNPDSSNLDWALVELDQLALYPPNLLSDSSSGGNYELQTPFRKPGTIARRQVARDVVFFSGFGGLRHGTLSILPSFLKIGHAKGMTETYSLSLSDGSGNIPPPFTM